MVDRIRVRQPSVLGTELLFEREGITDSIFFDALLTESPRDSNIITQHPVESGADISDHVQKQPTSLTLQVKISNTPLPQAVQEMRGLGALYAIAEVEGTGLIAHGRASLTYALLLTLKEEAVPVRIITGLRTYRNYIIGDVSPTRQGGPGSDSRNALDLSISLQEINTVEATIVTVDPSIFEEVVRSSATDENDGGNSELLDERPATLFFSGTTGLGGAVMYSIGGGEAAENWVEARYAADPESVEEYQRYLEREEAAGRL